MCFEMLPDKFGYIRRHFYQEDMYDEFTETEGSLTSFTLKEQIKVIYVPMGINPKLQRFAVH